MALVVMRIRVRKPGERCMAVVGVVGKVLEVDVM